MLNQIVLQGRLTKDPEMRCTPSNTPVTSFSLAVERDFADKGTGERQTDFIDCVAWRSTAEFVSKYFHRGDMAAVSGRLQIREWTDQNGAKRRVAEVQVQNMYFSGYKNPAGTNEQVATTAPAPASAPASAPAPAQTRRYQQTLNPAPQFDYMSGDGDLPF